ncbi:hypothetical protein G3N58_03730, partial [Paraburkholderia sp. Ac-20342]|nr:hypothetical protein [Paraburkholderia sp. Ac-20342]
MRNDNGWIVGALVCGLMGPTVALAQAAAPHVVGAPLRITTRVLDVAD